MGIRSWEKSRTNLFSAGAGVAKTIDKVWLNTKLDLYLLNSDIYYNAQIGAKYFPADDGKTNIMATASMGSAPETAVLDYALPGSFSHTNTMVGLGGQYLITPNITIGVMGTWNTYYNQNQYKNGRAEQLYRQSIDTIQEFIQYLCTGLYFILTKYLLL